MENKYNDFCICSPETYATIAKKYNEQLSSRKNEKEKQIVRGSQILSLLENNLEILERLPMAMQMKSFPLQKIYVKTYNLITVTKNEFNIGNYVPMKNEFHKNRLYASEIKKISINNLCQVLKELITCDNKKTALNALELIKCWAEIM